MSTMIPLYWLPFVFVALVNAAVEQSSEILPNKELASSNDKADSADLTSNQATAGAHLQLSQEDEDGFLGKEKSSLALAEIPGFLLATLMVFYPSELSRLFGFFKSVHGDGPSEEVSTTG
ncbi:hypothetical protein cyc_03537 [Cyclospora cayetanensis]|uniref:Uncharacterized protein n=1 Tax=Cyclospora cayetanensis TaxID=88456 RepID=A0A1D3CX25_9EIME|nr:hypothetical protein cyc_03537 [Cyclospora cayetanensis]